ncbi:MAG: NAD(P)H-dependent oxidoreductase [Prolixibacteraceae bacterium]|nr:NAD(P)H-dependent oxidoreductase [Prolixibacteraceae bacterium]
MKLTVFNGSPRRKKSNSTLLIQHFLNGYYANADHNTELHYLANTAKTASHVEAFEKADTALIIFPLYTDAMPGQVKYFFEQIASRNTQGKRVGFIVQSGFPESYHSIFIERYLKKLSRDLSWEYIGTVIKGGVEGIQIMPPKMTRKLYNHFEMLGKYFSATGHFDPKIVKKLGKPYRFSPFRRFVFRLMLLTGLANFYWNMKLKGHTAYSNRFDAPYAPA